MIEALAAGVPVVATDIASIAPMFEDPPTAVLDTNDTAASPTPSESLLSDAENGGGRLAANRALAESRYDRAVFRDALATIYRRHGRRGGRHG